MITSGQAGQRVPGQRGALHHSAGQPIGTLIRRIPSLVVADLVRRRKRHPNPGQVMVLDERSRVSPVATRPAGWPVGPRPHRSDSTGRADVGGTVYEGIATARARDCPCPGRRPEPSLDHRVTCLYAVLITQALQISIPWLGIFLLLMVALCQPVGHRPEHHSPLTSWSPGFAARGPGRPQHPIQIESHDEIGQLGQVESMRASIKSQR